MCNALPTNSQEEQNMGRIRKVWERGQPEAWCFMAWDLVFAGDWSVARNNAAGF